MSTDWRNQFTTGREQFHYVFHQGIFSDVKLQIDGVDLSAVDKKVILSHSLVLKIRSSVFQNLLEKVPTTKEGFKEVTILGFKVGEVKKFIQFLYTDELETTSTTETQRILHLAKKYKVQGLVIRCTSLLKTNLCAKNASSTYQTARELNEIELEGAALTFILSNASEVFAEDDFNSVNQMNLCQLLEKDELDISEIDAFFGILKWAKVECTRYKIQGTPKHLRLVLKEALNLIRFPVMTKDEFEEKVVPTGVLNEREITEINRWFDASPENRQFVAPALFSIKQRTCMVLDETLDLTKKDLDNHKRLARLALKKSRDINNPLQEGRKCVTVSNVIIEIEPKDHTQLDELSLKIFQIKKYGLHWGAMNVIKSSDKQKLLLSFAADDKRSYGVGSVVEEIEDTFPEIKTTSVKSFVDDIVIHL